MGGYVRISWVHVLSRDPYEHDYKVCAVASKHIIVVFPSYLALLMLRHRDRMEKSWVTCCRVEEGGFPSGKQKGLLNLNSSWMSTPGGALGPLTGWLSYMKCSFMQGGRKRQNICAAKATKAAYQNLILRWVNLPWSW